jgi:2-phospho-L-lactate guanylyltransferase
VSDSAAADLSALHVVVPLRGSGSGKSRLGEALDAEEREALVLGMLARTLDVLAAWTAVRQTWMVTEDERVIEALRRSRPEVRIVAQPLDGGLNGALRAARDAASLAGATAVLMLPADLPLLTLAALDALLEGTDAALAAGEGRSVVAIASSDVRGGTNALLLTPVDVIDPQFGEQSLEAHLRAAETAGASVQVLIDSALGFDLDTPEDLERLDVAQLLQLQEAGHAFEAETAEVG